VGPAEDHREDDDVKETMKAALPGVGGVFAAIGSAVCCAGPVVAVSLGVSGAGLAAFEPYRPYFLGATAAFLVLGFRLLDREEKAACVPGKPCADPAVRRRMKVSLWIATVVAVVFGDRRRDLAPDPGSRRSGDEPWRDGARRDAGRHGRDAGQLSHGGATRHRHDLRGL
jgi:mercuric ion transport protein